MVKSTHYRPTQTLFKFQVFTEERKKQNKKV